MNRLTFSLMAAILVFPALLAAGGKRTLLKVGPALSFGKYEDLSEVDGLLTGAQPGVELTIRCAKRFDIWGAYKFSKREYRLGHGTDRIFRLDAYAAGMRYKPVRFRFGEPFIGIGLNYYHFADDAYTPFVFPVKSAFGPYAQGGFYYRVLRPLQIQCGVRYSLVRHTEKQKTNWSTYHYRTDFSGLEFSAGLLFCIGGKQQKEGR